MPPRRTTSRATGQQSTLSFSNSRVTKPTATAPGKQIKETIKSNASHVVPMVVKSPEPPAADIVPEKEPEKETDILDEPQTEEDRKALKVTEVAIRKYWNEEERGRSAPRGMPFFIYYVPHFSIDVFLSVHQKDLDLDEKILRHFDLSTQYGVCLYVYAMLHTVRLTQNPAMHRHFANPTVATSPYARPQSANRGPSCSAERAENTGKRTCLRGRASLVKMYDLGNATFM